MSARLLFRDSQGRDGEVLLSQTAPTYVGRALDCAIRTDDAMVSRKHSMIRMEGGAFVVEDLGSSNGTHVNDVRVTKQPLAHNDVVRCGSLWLRYVEEGPVSQPSGASQPVAPARKAGTMRLDAGSGGAASGSGAGHAAAQPQPAASSQPSYGSNGDIGHAGTLAANQQALGSAPATPAAPAAPATPYGGPPSMPGEPAKPDSVIVDMGGDPDVLAKARGDLASAQERLEDLQARYDREVADGKRLRAETSTLRDRIEELRRGLEEKDDVVSAHDQVAEELRAELRGTKEDLLSKQGDMAELADSVSARERQLARVSEDVTKLKDEVEDRDRQLAEISRTKDEGWKKLNEQLSEIEHFREVITEQERMLEERRVGLVSQEEVIKELREGKEQMLVQVAQLKAERDELQSDTGRNVAKLTAIDEENRRLSRLLAEAQSGGSDASAVEHSTKLSGEVKDLRVEVKTLESDNSRLEGHRKTLEIDIDRLQSRVAKLEVDLREAREQREKALSARGIADEALAKAEVARHKAAEEALAAAQARDVTMSSTDDLRYELDRAKRRIGELESAKPAAEASAEPSESAKRERKALEGKLATAEAKIGELERSLATSAAELAAAQADALGGLTAPTADSPLPLEDTESTAVGVPAAQSGVLDKAVEVHDAINDVLSEIRNNLLLIQGEFGTLAEGDSSDSARIISDTLDTLVGNAEDAKGVLRSLKELVEFS